MFQSRRRETAARPSQGTRATMDGSGLGKAATGQGESYVRRHPKAPSAGSTTGTGSSRGLFGRAFATRGGSSYADGSGAPALRRLLLLAAVASASLLLSAAPAFASSFTVTLGGTGTGTLVSGQPGPFECSNTPGHEKTGPANCSSTAENFELSAVADAGSAFLKWEGTASTCRAMQGALRIRASLPSRSEGGRRSPQQSSNRRPRLRSKPRPWERVQ